MKAYERLNSIFEPLGYLVMPHQSDDNTNVWHLYIKDGEYGLDYFGSIEPDTDGHSYFVINTNVPDIEREVTSPEEAIELIKKYNAKLSVPSFCLDPVTRQFANLERTFIWYMKTLGFVHPRWDEYCSYGHSVIMVLKNMYGETISHLTLIIDDMDKDTGSITRNIKGNAFAWVESNFKGIYEMIASINSMLEPELLINVSNQLVTANNLTDDRSDNISFNKVDNSLNCYKINAKNAIKNALQNALDKLD